MAGFIEYLFTNESLKSIVRALRIREGDKVLACGGCGDQAFALVESAGEVKILENNPAQVELIKRRKQLLQEGDYRGFISDNPLRDRAEFYVEAGVFPQHRINRNRYFQRRGRLKRIREKLDLLSIQEGDLREEDQKYDKIYLSNILGYRDSSNQDSIQHQILTFSKRLKRNGLIYVANGSIFASYDFFPDLICDDQQTYIAYRYNRLTFSNNSTWNPRVFVKMLEASLN